MPESAPCGAAAAGIAEVHRRLVDLVLAGPAGEVIDLGAGRGRTLLSWRGGRRRSG
jgi:hypothetical protein